MIDWTDAKALIKRDRAERGKNSSAALELLAHLRAGSRAVRPIKMAADETPVPGQGAEARGMQIKALVGARLLMTQKGIGMRLPFDGDIQSSEPVLPACEVSVVDLARIAALIGKDERGAAMGLLAAARWHYGTGKRFSLDPVRVVGGWRGTTWRSNCSTSSDATVTRSSSHSLSALPAWMCFAGSQSASAAGKSKSAGRVTRQRQMPVSGQL